MILAKDDHLRQCVTLMQFKKRPAAASVHEYYISQCLAKRYLCYGSCGYECREQF